MIEHDAGSITFALSGEKMKIGVMTDLHGNVAALNAVLAKFDEERCDKIVCCGDIVGIGSHPEETVNAIMNIPRLIAIKGNHDRYCTDGVLPSDNMADDEKAHFEWVKSILSARSLDYLRALPSRVDFSADGKKITVMHYAVNDKNEYSSFVFNPTAADCEKLFAGIASDVVLYGHDHASTVNRTEKTLWLDCGSLGCPGREKNVARGGLLRVDRSGVEYEGVTLQYPVDRVLAEIDRLNYPCADYIRHGFFGVE